MSRKNKSLFCCKKYVIRCQKFGKTNDFYVIIMLSNKAMKDFTLRNAFLALLYRAFSKLKRRSKYHKAFTNAAGGERNFKKRNLVHSKERVCLGDGNASNQTFISYNSLQLERISGFPKSPVNMESFIWSAYITDSVKLREKMCGFFLEWILGIFVIFYGNSALSGRNNLVAQNLEFLY